LVSFSAVERSDEAAVPEEQRRLVDDIVGMDLDYQLYSMSAAPYGGYNYQVDIESLNYFVPSILAPDMRSKVEENVMPR